jgi:hypothetical protein
MSKSCNNGYCEIKAEPFGGCCLSCIYKSECKEICKLLTDNGECEIGEQVEDD